MTTESDRDPAEAISALAHELNTPLAAIRGFAELIGARDDERTRVEGATRILESADRLSATIDRLLARALEDEAVALQLTKRDEAS